MNYDHASYDLLKALEVNPGLSQRDLAKRLGISLGKVNSCLKALVEKGFLKVDIFRNNKRVYVYLLTPLGIEKKAHMTVEFMQIKMQEYEKLREEIAELRREAEHVLLEKSYE